jgi:hypothetical protein
MFPNESQIVVTTEDYAEAAVHACCVRHREFPEVRGEGPSKSAAANRLIEKLSAALDHAGSKWRKEGIGKAMDDVRAFAGQHDEPAAR